MVDYYDVARECAQGVHPQTMVKVVNVESSGNPYAIGVVDGYLVRQPANKAEAVATAKQLEKQGFNFSLGASQVNRFNLAKYDLDYQSAFDPCSNLRAGSKILGDCYNRALKQFPTKDDALKAAFSCYYSGNFRRGFIPDKPGEKSYVQKVADSSVKEIAPIKVVPVAKVKPKQETAPVLVQKSSESTPVETVDEKPKRAEWDVFGDF